MSRVYHGRSRKERGKKILGRVSDRPSAGSGRYPHANPHAHPAIQHLEKENILISTVQERLKDFTGVSRTWPKHRTALATKTQNSYQQGKRGGQKCRLALAHTQRESKGLSLHCGLVVVPSPYTMSFHRGSRGAPNSLSRYGRSVVGAP